ncbi:MAG: hypothetical protein LBH70_01400 [Spirochaetaceae bacterium]|nr:hypothetical protein [Spirochaetaceae bacterium]
MPVSGLRLWERDVGAGERGLPGEPVPAVSRRNEPPAGRESTGPTELRGFGGWGNPGAVVPACEKLGA